MGISLGEYFIRILKWDNKSEAQNYLNKCDLGKLEFEKDIYSNSYYLTFIVHRSNSTFGIGIYGQNNGIEPAIILDYQTQSLIAGFGRSVCFINIPSQNLTSQYELNCDFFSFFTLRHLGLDNVFLVQSEITITAFNYDGTSIWHYDFGDIIQNVELTEDFVLVSLYEQTSLVKLSLLEGTETT